MNAETQAGFSFSYAILQKMAEEYAISLRSFVKRHPNLTRFLAEGVDYLALSTQDTITYVCAEVDLGEFSHMVWRKWHKGRRIAIAELQEFVSLDPFGRTKMLLMTEPKFDEEGKLNNGLAYASFCYPELDYLRRLHGSSGDVQYAENETSALVLAITNEQQVRFTKVSQLTVFQDDVCRKRNLLVGGRIIS